MSVIQSQKASDTEVPHAKESFPWEEVAVVRSAATVGVSKPLGRGCFLSGCQHYRANGLLLCEVAWVAQKPS